MNTKLIGMYCIAVCVVVRIAKKGSETILHREFTESTTKHTEDNKAYRKCKQFKGDSYSLKKSKWRAATLVNLMVVATDPPGMMHFRIKR